MPLVDIEGLIGPIVIGSALGACACGIVLALSAHYFARFQQDKLWLRCAVVGGVVLALADTAATCSWAYRWGVRMFGQTVLLIERPWQLPVAIYLGSFTILCCQHFFLFRLYAVSGHCWWIVGPISACSLAGAGVAFYMASLVAARPTMAGLPAIGNVPWGWFGPTLCADILISASLLWFLNWGPRATLGVKPNERIRGIATSAARTNMISSLLQLATCILYSRYRHSLQWFCLSPILGKVHIASFIATLNARQGSSTGPFDEDDHHSPSSSRPSNRRRSIGGSRAVGRSGGGGGGGGGGGISVHQDITVATEIAAAVAQGEAGKYGHGGEGIPLGAYKVRFDRSEEGDGTDVEKGSIGP